MYVYVENNQVIESVENLPRNWRNVSGLSLLSLAELRQLGWRPVVTAEIPFDPSYQIKGDLTFEVTDEEVVATPTITDQNVLSLIEARKSQINRLRDIKINEGIVWNGHAFDTDIAGRANITSIVASISAGISLPEGFSWRTADNNNVVMTEQDVKDLAQVMVAHVNHAYVVSWTHKENLDALSDGTAQAVAEYDITVGW